MLMRFIMSFYLSCIHDTHLVHMHAICASEGVTLLEFKPEQQEEQLAARSRRFRQKKDPMKKISLSALTIS
jgi:hypothetical protein